MSSKYWQEDERRLPRMKELWAEGHSASQVAAKLKAELGGYPTRNAIVSKIHREGLSDAGRASSRTVMSRRQRRAGRVKAHASAQAKKPAKAAGEVADDRSGNSWGWGRPAVAPIEPYREEAEPAFDVPAKQMVTFVGLEEHHCKWPVGDPRSEAFRFCGGKRVQGAQHPYCRHHIARATRASEATAKGKITVTAAKVDAGGGVGSPERQLPVSEPLLLESEDA